LCGLSKRCCSQEPWLPWLDTKAYLMLSNSLDRQAGLPIFQHVVPAPFGHGRRRWWSGTVGDYDVDPLVLLWPSHALAHTNSRITHTHPTQSIIRGCRAGEKSQITRERDAKALMSSSETTLNSTSMVRRQMSTLVHRTASIGCCVFASFFMHYRHWWLLQHEVAQRLLLCRGLGALSLSVCFPLHHS
jgi:hypothetical protein